MSVAMANETAAFRCLKTVALNTRSSSRTTQLENRLSVDSETMVPQGQLHESA